MEQPRKTTGKRNQTLVIVPAYNEAASIEKAVRSIQDFGFDLIVVNDGSTDGTAAILQSIGAPHINLISNLGIGGAVQTGYKYAQRHGYEIAVQFDGDGQHDASYISTIIHPIIEGEANLVIGSRFIGNESEFQSSGARRSGIKMLSWALKIATGKRIHDVTSGFRAADKNTIALFADNYPTDYPEPESIAYAIAQGYSVTEVPVSMNERSGGSSSISGIDIVWYMVKVGLSILLRGTYNRRTD